MSALIVRQLSQLDYEPTWASMRSFTDQRDSHTPDEIWLLEHPPVFTQGLAGKAEHVLNPHDIPVVQTDRGGQVTYHGPGQLMLYALLDLRRLNIGARQLVSALEQTVIDYLADLNISASNKPDAPGVYVAAKKICSIGLRVRRGCSYHGIALNVDTDLTPFTYINPCGFQGLQMTQVSALAPSLTLAELRQNIVPFFMENFAYQEAIYQNTAWQQPTLTTESNNEK